MGDQNSSDWNMLAWAGDVVINDAASTNAAKIERKWRKSWIVDMGGSSRNVQREISLLRA
jgi:hypothetical protein